MHKMKQAIRTASVFALMFCAGSGISAARADVLAQVPSDAAIVLKMNHIADTSTRLAAMLQQMGITDLVPTLKDPLAALQDMNGFGPGLNLKGDAAYFCTADEFTNQLQHGEQGGVLLIAVSDYAAFLGSETVVRTEGDTSVVHFKGAEADMFIQHWGDYAAITRHKEVLAVKHDGLKAIGASVGELANDDAIIYTNLIPFKQILLPMLDDGQKAMLDQIQSQHLEAGKEKVATAAAKQAVQMAREFLNDTQGLALGITFGDKGIKSCFTVDFIPDTYLGKVASTMKQTDGSLIAGLPNEPYIACGGFTYDAAWTTRLFDDLVNPIATELPAMGDDGKKWLDIIATARGIATTAEGATFEMTSPTNAAKPANLISEIFVWRGDADKMKAGQGRMLEMMGPMMNGMMQLMAAQIPGGNANAGGDLFKTSITPNFKTIENVSFDRWQLQVNPDNTSQMAMQMQQSFTMMYGQDGMNILSGSIDSKTYLAGFGVSDELLGEAINAAKSGQDPLSDSLKEINAQLPKNRAGVEYIGLGQYMSAVINMMKAQGLPINIAVPTTLPPVGIALGSSDSSLRVDVYVPVTLMQGLMQAGMQGYMQMQGRKGQDGGGGGL